MGRGPFGLSPNTFLQFHTLFPVYATAGMLGLDPYIATAGIAGFVYTVAKSSLTLPTVRSLYLHTVYT